MAIYNVNGTATIDVNIKIEAESLEEAMEIAEDYFQLNEYCDGTIGGECDGNEIELVDNDWIEWHKEFSECISKDEDEM